MSIPARFDRLTYGGEEMVLRIRSAADLACARAVFAGTKKVSAGVSLERLNTERRETEEVL
jgi:hypothetical protein